MEVLFLFIMIITLLMTGVPIGVSLGFSSIVFLLIFSDSSLGSIANTLFDAMFKHSTLLAIPFFILASSFMSTGGVAKRIIRFANATVGHFQVERVMLVQSPQRSSEMLALHQRVLQDEYLRLEPLTMSESRSSAQGLLTNAYNFDA